MNMSWLEICIYNNGPVDKWTRRQNFETPREQSPEIDSILTTTHVQLHTVVWAVLPSFPHNWLSNITTASVSVWLGEPALAFSLSYTEKREGQKRQDHSIMSDWPCMRNQFQKGKFLVAAHGQSNWNCWTALSQQKQNCRTVKLKYLILTVSVCITGHSRVLLHHSQLGKPTNWTAISLTCSDCQDVSVSFTEFRTQVRQLLRLLSKISIAFLSSTEFSGKLTDWVHQFR